MKTCHRIPNLSPFLGTHWGYGDTVSSRASEGGVKQLKTLFLLRDLKYTTGSTGSTGSSDSAFSPSTLLEACLEVVQVVQVVQHFERVKVQT